MNAPTTHDKGATPDAGKSSRQCQGDLRHGAPWAGQWLRDQLDRMESEAAIARLHRHPSTNIGE